MILLPDTVKKSLKNSREILSIYENRGQTNAKLLTIVYLWYGDEIGNLATCDIG